MKLTVHLKLKPTTYQADALRRTLETANAACDYISRMAWESTTFRQFALHRLTYQAVRETFGLSAQLTVRCIAKVADAYKLDRKTQRCFQPHGAIAYDSRILSFALPDTLVSIWTLDGRQAIPFVCGAHQRRLLSSQRGESDLVLLKGVPVHFVDPRNTSRTCPACGHCAKENRKTQASFVCTSCGFAGPADVIAAGKIARRAAVNRPHCSEAEGSVAPEQSRSL